MKSLCIPVLALGPSLLATVLGPAPLPQSVPPAQPAELALLDQLAAPVAGPERPWSLTGFLGRADDERFAQILRFEGGDLLDSYIAGVALNRHVLTLWDHLDWEVEGSTYTHWGIEDHWEINAAVLARWTHLPWDQLIDTSVAFGQGLSWASERPILEGDTRRFLHHLIAEIDVHPVRTAPLSLVLRVHHRSGVFGLYGASGGANFLTLGLRYRF